MVCPLPTVFSPNITFEKIICAYSSTNLHVEQIEALRNLVPGIEIEIIGLSTISHDLLIKYPFLAFEYLNIPIDTHQIFAIEDFIKIYDKNGISAPLDMKFFIGIKKKKSYIPLLIVKGLHW